MRRKKREAALVHKTTTKVRFSEVDIMNIAWHGSYVKYLEDGREDFGAKYTGLGYMDMYAAGFKAPIVDMQIEYKNPVTVSNVIEIEVRFIDCEAAKIQFDYILYTPEGKVAVTASTTQVFLDENNALVLTNPEFYTAWKKKWNIG